MLLFVSPSIPLEINQLTPIYSKSKSNHNGAHRTQRLFTLARTLRVSTQLKNFKETLIKSQYYFGKNLFHRDSSIMLTLYLYACILLDYIFVDISVCFAYITCRKFLYIDTIGPVLIAYFNYCVQLHCKFKNCVCTNCTRGGLSNSYSMGARNLWQ